MMVGEIRDRETLDMAMESAMTGHLVFSTVHTNSSAETIARVYNL
jgi:type II secretory ATPase GspE/PulE/Tfp pilus assembly ATPase PilB-like protein